MIKKSLLALVVAGSMVAGAQAASPNGYLFANIGQSDADASRFGRALDEIADDVAFELDLEGRSSFDKKDSAFKIGAGIQLNQHVALEFQYLDLGEIAYKAVGRNEDLTGSLRASAGTDGFGANLVGTLPFDRFKLFGKIGYHKLKTEARYTEALTFEGETFSFRASDSANEWITSFGVGASYAFTPAVELVAEYERYRDVGDEYDVDFASVGLRYNF
ncbi:porin family protein [Pseudomonas sp.]|uniref:porin family protein n=1 Tax=Pseudomonas sp. TaxID=306 RepID=UPI00272BE9AB|nr:porin family protein [Pseudomonas sp.]